MLSSWNQKNSLRQERRSYTRSDFYIPLGKGEIKREGTDLTIVTYGRMLERVLKAAEEVAEQGINVEVVD